MADTDAPQLDLNTLIPLLQSKQKLDAAGQSSKAALGLAGQVVAPNLYDMVVNPRPQHQPLPNPGGPPGKVPPQQGLDPRMVGAMSEIGQLGLGGAAAKMASPMLGATAEGASGLGGAASRLGGAVNEAGPAKAAIGLGMQSPSMFEPSQANAANIRLTPDQRREAEQKRIEGANAAQIEADKQKALGEADVARQNALAENARKDAAAKAEQARKDQEAQALLDRQLKQQAETDAEEKAKKEREQPFSVAHPFLARSMPVAGMLGSAFVPAWMKARGKAPLEQFVKDWRSADKAADTALKGKLKGPATVAAEKLRDFENKWPQMEQRFTPGAKTNAAAAFLPAEMAAFPTEYDLMTQGKNSPGRPSGEDIAETGARAAGAAAIGGFGSKLGPAMVTPVAPYTGGGGTIKAYERKYPPTKTELAAQAARAAMPPPVVQRSNLPAIVNRLRGK